MLAPAGFPALPLAAAWGVTSCEGAVAAAREELRCFCLRLATAAASSCAPALWPKRGSVGSSANAGLLKMAEKRASSSFACKAFPQSDTDHQEDSTLRQSDLQDAASGEPSLPVWQEFMTKLPAYSLTLAGCQGVSSLLQCVSRGAGYGRLYWLTLKAGASAARSSSSLPALRSCSLAAFFCLARSLRDSFALPCCLPSPSPAQS